MFKEKVARPFGLEGVYTRDEKSIEEQIIAKLKANIPVFLHGKPGVGKSARVKQIDKNLEILELTLTNIEELTGYTIADEKGEIMRVMPTWYERLVRKCEEEPDKIHILFLDELTNASPAIQKLAYSLILDRKVAGTWKLPENTRIVSAGNEVEDSITVEEIPLPLKNRMAHINVPYDMDAWLKWAKSLNEDGITNIDERVIDAVLRLLSFRSDFPREELFKTRSPRKLEMLSKLVRSGFIAEPGMPEQYLVYDERKQNFKTTEEMIRGYIEADVPVFIHGKPGVGKSQRVRDIDPDLTTLELSLIPIEDLTGLSVCDNGKAKLLMPEWLKEMYKKCEEEPDKIHILFLDELTNALPSVQTLAYSLVLNKRVANRWDLPSNVRIVAAGNEIEDSSVAQEIPVPLQDRFMHVNVSVKEQEWLLWAVEHNIDPRIICYVGEKYAFRDEPLYKEISEDGVRITPRTWERASQLLKSTNDLYMLQMVLGPTITRDLVAVTGFAKKSEIPLMTGKKADYSGFRYITKLLRAKERNYRLFKDLLKRNCRDGELAGQIYELLWKRMHRNREERINSADEIQEETQTSPMVVLGSSKSIPYEYVDEYLPRYSRRFVYRDGYYYLEDPVEELDIEELDKYLGKRRGNGIRKGSKQKGNPIYAEKYKKGFMSHDS